MTSGLHADVLRALQRWKAPSAEAEATRQRFLAFLAEGPDVLRREHPGAHLTASALVVGALMTRDRARG